MVMSPAMNADHHATRADAPAVSRRAEIVPEGISGGANTSHTIVVDALSALLAAVPAHADADVYGAAALDDNALGKSTDGSRRRTFRYLKELYLLRPDSLLFRALRDLWPMDPAARPLLAGSCALARDSVFRASSAAILASHPGDDMAAADFAEAVDERFEGNYGESTLAKIGRNTFSSWQQTGHLTGSSHGRKQRRRADCRPANVAYALLLGHLEGAQGRALFDTVWARTLDQPAAHLHDLAVAASQQGLIDVRSMGGVFEVDFTLLLRPFEGELL
jgi:hypothetical protein